MPDEPDVSANLRVPPSVRRAVKQIAHERGLTTRGVWLSAIRLLGVNVPDAEIEDRRVTRRGKP